MSTIHQIAFWNLENLFDIENSPRRTEKVARAVGTDIKSWDQAKLNAKIVQLASVIRKMNVGQGPDLLGVCEVENKYVLELLVQALAPLKRNYAIVHHDTDDRRGIDVAFIYDQKFFKAEEVFSHVIMKRTATRDLVQVNFRTTRGRQLVVVGNHWPSRTGGESESEAYRMMAGETLSYFHERIIEVLGKDTPVLAMGDFNDEPFNPSLTDYALALRTSLAVARGRNPYFLNMMWPMMGRGIGSHYFDGPIMLDQFLVNKNLLRSDLPLRITPDSANVLRFPEMLDASTGGPRRFGGMGKTVDPKGFSDHFPVEVTLEEKD
jgi:hypothetical protein